MSVTDNGNEFKNGHGYGALDRIGEISPQNWLWSPQGFYDNNKPLESWAPWKKRELISYTELRDRIRISAERNN